jgi:hypothetical protein
MSAVGDSETKREHSSESITGHREDTPTAEPYESSESSQGDVVVSAVEPLKASGKPATSSQMSAVGDSEAERAHSGSEKPSAVVPGSYRMSAVGDKMKSSSSSLPRRRQTVKKSRHRSRRRRGSPSRSEGRRRSDKVRDVPAKGIAKAMISSSSFSSSEHGRKRRRESRAGDVKGDSSKRARLIPNKERSAVFPDFEGVAHRLRGQSSSARCALAVGSELPEIELRWLSRWADIPVFRESLPLWSFLAQQKREPGMVGMRQCVFCLFDVDNLAQEQELRCHLSYWTSLVKDMLRDDEASSTLMKSIFPKPFDGGRWRQQFTGSVVLSASMQHEMRGLLAKYNGEYRLPYPQHHNVEFESWKKVAKAQLHRDQIRYFGGPQFHIKSASLNGTILWPENQNFDEGDVKWNAVCSSMVVPAASAVGDEDHYHIRKVLGIRFAGLCWLFQHYFSAEKIEQAWACMPIIKWGKKNRGFNTKKPYRW